MTKKKRHTALKHLVSNFQISDQDHLVALLAEHHAINTNQSIISRDLRELGIGKKIKNQDAYYSLPTTDSTQELLAKAVLEVCHNESMIVVHTLNGLADFVGDYLDNQESDAILGTLAGENSLFIAPSSTKNIQAHFEKICALLNYQRMKEL